MARLPRLSVGGVPHLLVQRGHNLQPVVRDAEDRSLFLALLGEVAAAHGVVIHAYALLEQEVRLLLTPAEPTALSRMMQVFGRRYGGAFNRRHGRSGSLWEGRFRATVLEPERHLLAAMRWLEEPEGEGIVSSRRHHLGEKTDPIVSDHSHFWSLGNTPFEREVAYRQLLASPLPLAEVQRLTAAVVKGWPLGSEPFVAGLARATARRLTPLPRGRPPKPKSKIADPN
jgi:putative transposase